MAVSPTDYTKYSKQCMMLSTLVSGSVQNKVGGLYALALSAYGSDANFKTVFFCDDIVTWVDGENKSCVVGICTENSDNYNHHASGRRSYLRVTRGGNNYVIMNDAGLNTMPHAAFPSNALKAHYCNYIKVQVGMTAAYYIGGNSFEVHIYKNGSWVYSQYAKYNQPAQYTNITTVTFENVSGLTEGDQITLVASATNAEGTYTQPTVITTTLLARMSLTQVYYWSSIPSSSTDPTTGTPYVMRIEQSMYYYSATALSGEFYRLFNNTGAGDPLNVGAESGGEWLYGAAGTPSTVDPLNISALPDGYYWGVPTTWQGSTLKYVQVSTVNGSKRLYWYNNTYVPYTGFSITMELRGSYDTTYQQYLIYVWVNVTGTLPSGGASITTELHRAAPTLSSRTKLADYSGTITSNSYCLNSSNPYRQSGNEQFVTYNTVCNSATSVTEAPMISTLNIPTS